MGSVCPSCYKEKHGKLWTMSQDDSPALCPTHLHKEHPNEICRRCGNYNRDHTLGPLDRTIKMICPPPREDEKKVITEFNSFPAETILLRLLASMNKRVVYYPYRSGSESDKYEIEDYFGESDED